MATVRIYREERGGEDFPRLCLKCGAEADSDVTNTFTWVPSWVIVIILAGLLPWLIVASLLRKSMRVTVPMCGRHRGHWLNRRLYLWLGLLGWIAYGVALAVVADDLPKEVFPVALGVLIFGGLLWLIVGLVYTNSGIKPREITDQWIELVGVHRDFEEAWDEVAPPPVPKRRKGRRTRPRDDDEDDDDRY
jgi:hypothetical protein